ncbi:YopX family protein [Bacillus safensis]|uniref:YopX family protein n=1 Tax=Bacillus safensis TaxID=561879 RepID=UPI000BF7662B|nr:YopX family protein [Bacillus safensis]PGC67582.1 hypothetical protein COL97_01435 [Bacillus safensis]
MDIVIRYIFKHRFSGNIEIKKYSTSQLEAQEAKKLSPCFYEADYELIARNLFTGLKDKNGIEIYEWDVLKVISAYYGHEIIATVKYENSLASFVFETGEDQGYSRIDASFKGVEVIGNIYQKPDLLEEAR